MIKLAYHYYFLWYKLWPPLKIMDNISRGASTNNFRTNLCQKRAYTDLHNQMEPGDADKSPFEEIYLQDKILRVLNSNYDTNADITYLYKNDNFLYDPSALSYYEDETETGNSSYIQAIQKIVPRSNNRNNNVTVLYTHYPVEQHAELVDIGTKQNVVRRIWGWFKHNLSCVKSDSN